MKKKVILIVIIILLLILLFPIPMRLRDGGSIRFQALLYNVTIYHQLNHQTESGYVDGIGIEILGAKVLNTIDKKIETVTTTEERIKLSDLKIKQEGVDTNKLVKFNNTIYGQAYGLIDYAGDINKTIGQIDFLIEEEYLPQINGETNCAEFHGSGVLEANEKVMVLNINNVAVLFRTIENSNIRKTNGELLFEKCGENEGNNSLTYNSFVGTVLEETTTYVIVEPNEDEEERKTADKIRVDFGVDHLDYLYGIGRKIIINYSGYIKETYPAQIESDDILIDGYKEFELIVKEAESKNKSKILNNMELYKNNSDYDLYYVGLEEVNIVIDNKTMSLEEALRSGKMTIDGILAKANRDVSDGKIKSDMIKDGGTTEWYYEKYNIVKKHTLDGDRDVYILRTDLKNRDI